MATPKTVWVADDRTTHETEALADHHDKVRRIASELEKFVDHCGEIDLDKAAEHLLSTYDMEPRA